MQPRFRKRYRFPKNVIRRAVSLYSRFTTSFRDLEYLFAERGIAVSYKAVRAWTIKFGPAMVSQRRRSRTPPTGRWRLDEMVMKIGGRRL